VLVRTHAKVFDSLTRVPLSPQQDSVGSSRCTQSELVEGKNLTTGLEDAVLGRLGESQSGDGEFGNLEETDVIGDGPDIDDGFRGEVRNVFGFFYDAREGDGRFVDLGEEKAMENDLDNMGFEFF